MEHIFSTSQSFLVPLLCLLQTTASPSEVTSAWGHGSIDQLCLYLAFIYNGHILLFWLLPVNNGCRMSYSLLCIAIIYPFFLFILPTVSHVGDWDLNSQVSVSAWVSLGH